MFARVTGVVAVVAALATAAPIGASAASSLTDAQLDATVSTAVAKGRTAVKALVQRSRSDYRLANAVLRQATVSTTTTSDPVAPSTAARAFLRSGPVRCHGTESAKTTIGIAGVDLGWRKAKVNEWCWDDTRLTSADVDSDKWSGFGYCWKDENNFKEWLIYPTRQKYVSKGTLAGIAPWGCAGAQQTISPNVHYEIHGGWNTYAHD
ncbi:hypothetical protein [Patulibacter defluvii]|uniref:hypothetical protein n=1 Tax=Patulibacter defluvii TaxID=3095358 RepID=UPI002A7653C1|nr:hypothetical protein [Patulibacter sp. DM4]